MSSEGSFSVFFEDPFWVGVFESYENGILKIAKVTFYKEPTERELQEFLIDNYDKIKFFKVEDSISVKNKMNPKRKLRDAKKQMNNEYSISKSKEYISSQFELNKINKKKDKSKEKKFLKDKKFIQKQAQRKEKHRGH